MHMSLTLCDNISYGCHMNIRVIYFPTLGKHSRLITVLFVSHLSEIILTLCDVVFFGVFYNVFVFYMVFCLFCHSNGLEQNVHNCF